ncbi:MAG: hypothetical protein HY868_25090 [Chloroflexi bacterium]|nr:hypothetical protein [Chloroflexota bacterium]
MDEEKQRAVQDLVRQIQDKSVELADLEVILEDYERERHELLREIGRLKASLWELSSGTPAIAPLRKEKFAGAPDQISE